MRCSSWWACWSCSDITWRGKYMDQHLLSHRAVHAAGRACWSCCSFPRAQQEPDQGLGQPGRLRRVPGFPAAGLALRQNGVSGFQFVERADWIPSLGAQYLIGIDGISLLLVMLTTLMGFIAILSSLERHSGPAQGILRHVPAAADGHARRIHVARFLPVLRLLGTGAGAHVLHHRRSGAARASSTRPSSSSSTRWPARC